MHLLMSAVEDGLVSGPGLTVGETVFTYVVIPVALFAVIALISWIASAPREERKAQSITSIN